MREIHKIIWMGKKPKFHKKETLECFLTNFEVLLQNLMEQVLWLIFFLISDWCAKYYEHSDYNGWEKVVGEISQLDLTNENDQTSSVKVRPGCTLTLFKHWHKVELLYSLTTDVSLLGHNDQVSSLSCACSGMKKSFFFLSF